jgi:hypothetical protein
MEVFAGAKPPRSPQFQGWFDWHFRAMGAKITTEKGKRIDMRPALVFVVLVLLLGSLGIITTGPIEAGILAQATGYPGDTTPFPTQPGGGQEAYPTQAIATQAQATATPIRLTSTRTPTSIGRTNTPSVVESPVATLPAGTPNRLLTEQAEMGGSKVTPPPSETPRLGTATQIQTTTPTSILTNTPTVMPSSEGRFFQIRWGFFLVGMFYALILGSVAWIAFVFVRKKLL